MHTIPRLPPPTRASFLSGEFAEQRPVIFTGCLPAWGDDPLGHIVREAGHRMVPVYESIRASRAPFSFTFKSARDFRPNADVKQRRLADLVSDLRTRPARKAGKCAYLQSVRIEEKLPELKASTLCPIMPEVPGRIWLGSGQRVGTHFDSWHNLALLVGGEKRFTLFAPDQRPNMYIGPPHASPYGAPISRVDLWRPDFAKYPKFRIALENTWSADLEPGEMLFVPARWWHAVESVGANLALNYWWA